MGQGSLVPSRALEHAKWLVGTAGDLESTLHAIDGVLSARVHLAAPAQNTLDLNEERPPPTASVLLRHRGATPPIATGDIQRLVAGAVPGLDPKAVSVVNSSAPPRSRRGDRLLAQVGPLTVTQASLLPLKAIFGTVIGLNLVLLALFAWQWTRARRAQDKLSEFEATEGSASAA
jgi:type III secretory pathway lipoprotein EscJ